MSEMYKGAGVDVEAGYEAVRLMKQYVAKTMTQGVLSDLGGFGGMFELGSGYHNPVLVSGTDGVGTKLKVAFLLNKHDTVGIDCVAMCVNDIACSGAKPLFFLDYIALGKNVPEKVASIVKGVSEGCQQAGCALVGGETAEMPGFYHQDEYDIAGFAVGVVDKEKIISGKDIVPGDALIGIASSGVHSNGFSLVRKLFYLNDERAAPRLDEYSELLSCRVGEELIKPTKIYVDIIQKLISQFHIKAISHITGGGFYENIPRMLPVGTYARIIRGRWEVLPIFKLISSVGMASEQDMFGTFNMGIGLVLAVDSSIASAVVDFINSCGEKAYQIGTVEEGNEGVKIL